jgi:hypothetical protein
VSPKHVEAPGSRYEKISRCTSGGEIEEDGGGKGGLGLVRHQAGFLLLVTLISGVSTKKLHGNIPSPTRGQKYCLVIIPFVDCCVMTSD